VTTTRRRYSVRQARLALSLIVEPGDQRLAGLFEQCDPVEAVVALRGGGALPLASVPRAWRERAQAIDQVFDQARRDADAAAMRWVCPGDRDWPTSLDELEHLDPIAHTRGAPLGLWVRGRGSLRIVTEQSLAVVGARACTTYGAECASDMGADLTDRGWTVVSGAAFGIDACAHRGALAMGKPTVAVLACGVDVEYPRAHATLLGRISEDGLVVSEHAPKERPHKNRFLSRNRIIAALTRGTVVIEAAQRSGSLNTLHWADQLGRVTMAIPGPVTSAQSAGVHDCLRQGRAVLVTGAGDVIEEIAPLGQVSGPSDEDVAALRDTDFDLLPPAHRAVLEALEFRASHPFGTLIRRSRLSEDEARRAIGPLHRAGLIERQADGWVLVRRADLEVNRKASQKST
jgi:DNA processing protein